MKLVEPRDIFTETETTPISYGEGNYNAQACLNHLPFLSRKLERTTIASPYTMVVTKASMACQKGTFFAVDNFYPLNMTTFQLKNEFDQDKNFYLAIEPNEFTQDWYFSRSKNIKSRIHRWKSKEEEQLNTLFEIDVVDVFMTAIYYLEKGGDEKRAMKALYSELYDLLAKKDFDKCNKYINAFLSYRFGIKLFVAFLTITKPYRDRISERNKLYKTLKEIVTKNVGVLEAQNILSHVE